MSNPGKFQTQVGVQPAIGVEGDFASANPRYSALAGAGALVAGVQGVTVGRFVWADPTHLDDVSAPAIVNNFGAGPVLGFVHRGQQALITAYLDGASLVIPQGLAVGDVMISGDFLAKNAGTTLAVPGMKAYANVLDGSISFANTGSTINGATSTSSSIAAETNSWTGSIAGNVLTVAGSVTGVVAPGTTVSGTGVQSGTVILSQLSGTPGGVGTYLLNIADQTVASEAMTGTYGLLTVGGTVTGAFAVGQQINGSGVAAGTTIRGLGTGLGNTGTYYVDNNTVVAGPEVINASSVVETKWYARSSGLAGELVKISDTPLG